MRRCGSLAQALGISARCRWLGQVSDAAKHRLYERAELYVLPSYSENFGNTVAEALAHGTPVITTRHTPWHHLPAAGCGWIADASVASLQDSLATALQIGREQRAAMGEAGRRLVAARYSIESVVRQIERVYRWLLGGPEPTDLLAA